MDTRTAADVARKAMSAVTAGSRDDWIGLFAECASLEDPVDGTSGRLGRAAIAEFWDTNITALDSVRFDIRRVHAVPGEALVLADVTVTAPGGASAHYDAAVHYRLNKNGEIESLRAFWDLPSVLAQLA
jgi:steroid delta-isomerase